MFDHLFLYCVVASVSVYAIAIPFFLMDYTSLPLTVGILTGTMWIPFSWIVGHPIGVFHSLARTGLVTAAWFLFPTQRFFVIPMLITAVYGITILILERRWQRQRIGMAEAA